MTADDDPELTRVLANLRLQLAEPIDFTSTDPDATIIKVRVLSAAAKYFNVLAITEFGGRIGPTRQEGLVEQVVAASFQTFHGIDPHPSPFDKAAMLLRGIVQGHPFTDANKRTGFLVAVYFLDRVGFVLRQPLTTAEVVSFCRRVSAGEVRDLRLIAGTLQAWTQPRRVRPGQM
jgi:prophage maintenance system killer protein